jgi:hypothetical protein
VAVLLFLSLAFAEPLKIDLTPTPASGLQAYPRATYGRLPVTDAEVVVDGTREALWDSVDLAPTLLPLADGFPVDFEVRAAASSDAFVVRIDPLPDTWFATVAVDPDGSGRVFWRVQHNPGSTWLTKCEHPPAEDTYGVNVLPRALPCESVPASGPLAARGDDGSEIAIPWADMTPATSRMRVLVKVTDGGRRGGTNAANGSGVTYTASGVPIDRTASGNSWVLVDATTGDWTLFLRNTPANANPTWTWRRTRLGTVVDEGVLDLTVADTVVMPPLEFGLVVVREEGVEPIQDAFNVTVPVLVPDVRVHTPVARDSIELTWSANRPATSRVTLTTPAGDLIGEASIDLPRGSGNVSIARPDDAPGLVYLDVEPGLPSPVRITFK